MALGEDGIKRAAKTSVKAADGKAAEKAKVKPERKTGAAAEGTKGRKISSQTQDVFEAAKEAEAVESPVSGPGRTYGVGEALPVYLL